jgi:O-antigen biosynthesis protein
MEMTPDKRMARKHHHVSDALIRLVDAVAAAREDFRPVIDPMRQRNARAALREHPLIGHAVTDDCPLIVIQPGAGSVMRQWPALHFADLADLLVEQHNVNIVLIGTADEEPIAKRVLNNIRNTRTVSAVGATSLAEVQLIIQAADIMIGNNSGPHHMAAAFGTPTVGIHSGVVDVHEWGPLGANAIGIAKAVYCRPCYLERISDCPHNHACMRRLTVNDVYTALPFLPAKVL